MLVKTFLLSKIKSKAHTIYFFIQGNCFPPSQAIRLSIFCSKSTKGEKVSHLRLPIFFLVFFGPHLPILYVLFAHSPQWEGSRRIKALDLKKMFVSLFCSGSNYREGNISFFDRPACSLPVAFLIE